MKIPFFPEDQAHTVFLEYFRDDAVFPEDQAHTVF